MQLHHSHQSHDVQLVILCQLMQTRGELVAVVDFDPANDTVGERLDHLPPHDAEGPVTEIHLDVVDGNDVAMAAIQPASCPRSQ